MTNAMEIKKPAWLSQMNTVNVLSVGPEDVWDVLPEDRKATITKDEIAAVLERAPKYFSELTDSYWDTIRDAVEEDGI